MTSTTESDDGLSRWLRDVELLHARALQALDVDVVHDLRVAIRRCRSLAQGLKEIDTDAGAARWKALSDAGRPLFQGLGALRDAQVMHERASELFAADPARDDVLAALARRIAATKEGARVAVDAFEAEAWRAAAAGLPERAALLFNEGPNERALFDHLVLRRFFEAKALHVSAMRSRSAPALHELRIGIKKLRYTVENFLPEAHRRIGKIAKKMQQVLGDIHDLDVLVEFLASPHVQLPANDRSRVVALVRRVCAHEVLGYRALSVGGDGAWPKLRAALLTDDRAVARAHTALIERKAATRADPAAARALLRSAFALLRALQHRLRPLAEPRAAVLLRRACASALVDGGGKRARRFVDRLPLAVGFGERERALLACVARAALDQAPAANDKRVLALLTRDQAMALAVGALLHVAMALVPTAPFVVRKSKDVVVFATTQPFPPTSEGARAFAAARAPLEALLALPLWIEPAADSSRRTFQHVSVRPSSRVPRAFPRGTSSGRPSARTVAAEEHARHHRDSRSQRR